MDFYEEREAPFVVEESQEPPKEKTKIQNYYTGKTILVTGGTGFIGTLIIEKLLRCCSDLKKLIIILRSKRGKSLQQRVREHFNNVIYEEMMTCNPNYWKKIEIVSGDCEQPNFGIETSIWNRLQQEVNVIFHSAATIRFDEHIRTSYNVNVAGTKSLLKLAEGASNLNAFVYVSTAYSPSHVFFVNEDFYPTPFTDEQMVQLLNVMNDATLNCMTPIILDGRANTYVMTKALAENVIKPYVGILPVAVFRPSIVTPTVNDPIVGWTNSISGDTGVVAGTAAGFLRTLHCDPAARAEIIPADRVVNALLTIPLHLQKRAVPQSLLHSSRHYMGRDDVVNDDTRKRMKTSLKNKEQMKEFIPVYNYTAKGRTINWSQQMTIFRHIQSYKYMQYVLLMWCVHLRLEKYYTLWILEFYVVHLLPLPFFLLMEKMMKLPPRVWRAYIKLYYYTKQYSFFNTNTWDFAWENTNDLISFADKEDRLLFNADNNIHWERYFYGMSRGGLTHLLKMDWNRTTNSQVVKKITTEIVDRCIIWIFFALVLWLFKKILLTSFKSIFY